MGVQDHQLGFIGSALARPACSNNMLQSGFYAPSQGTVHRSRTGSACNIHAISPLRRVLRSPIGRPRSGVQVTSSGSSAPLRPGPLLQVTPSVRVLRPAPGDGPLSQVHRPRTGSACHHCSPLRRVLRSSTGRPRSGAWVACSGSSGLLEARPACSSSSPWSGFYAPASGDGLASTLR